MFAGLVLVVCTVIGVCVLLVGVYWLQVVSGTMLGLMLSCLLVLV